MDLPNEFVFKEGASGALELVGDFNGLYSSEVDPWHQSGETGDEATRQYYNVSRSRLISLLRRRVGRQPTFVGLEVGCGHGHVTSYLSDVLEQPWNGVDISHEAIAVARKLHKNNVFFVGDITRVYPAQRSMKYDVVVLGQILWYVMHKMDIVMENCYNLLVPGGLLVSSQAYLTEEQRYGKELANGFGGAIKLFLNYEPRFHLVEASCERTRGLAHYDGLITLRKSNSNGT